MSEFRKLQAKLQKIEEGYFKDLDLKLQVLRRANSKLPADQLVRLARDQYGQEAATYLSDQLEREADYEDYKASDPQPHMTNLLGEEDEDSHDIEPLLNDEEYEMVKRVMAPRGHEPHSLGFDSKGNINAKDDLSYGGPEYVISQDGKIVSLTYGPGYEECSACKGKGRVSDLQGFKQPCETCDAEGRTLTGAPAGTEINPPKQGWMDKFRSVIGEEEGSMLGKQEGPSAEGEMSMDEIVEIGKQNGVDEDGVWKAVIFAHDRDNKFWEMEMEVRAPSGEIVGRFSGFKDMPLDATDPATGKEFRILTDQIYVIYKTSPAKIQEMFGWYKEWEAEQQAERDAEPFWDWIEKNPFESIEEDVGGSDDFWAETERQDAKIAEFTINEFGDLGFKRHSNWPAGTNLVANGDLRKQVRTKFKIEGWTKAEPGSRQPSWYAHPTLPYHSVVEYDRGRTIVTSMLPYGAKIEEDTFIREEDSINQQIKSLLAQGKKVMSRVSGAIGEIISINDEGISMVQGGVGAGTDGVNFGAHSNLKIIIKVDGYEIIRRWNDDGIDEGVGDWIKRLDKKAGDWITDKTEKLNKAQSTNTAKRVAEMVHEEGIKMTVIDIRYTSGGKGKLIQKSLEEYLQHSPDGEYAEEVRYVLPALDKDADLLRDAEIEAFGSVLGEGINEGVLSWAADKLMDKVVKEIDKVGMSKVAVSLAFGDKADTMCDSLKTYLQAREPEEIGIEKYGKLIRLRTMLNCKDRVHESHVSDKIAVGNSVMIMTYDLLSNRRVPTEVKIVDFVKHPGARPAVHYKGKDGKVKSMASNVFKSKMREAQRPVSETNEDKNNDCDRCQGLGHHPSRADEDCPECGGTGKCPNINEAVIEVPAELRGNTKMTGKATSDDAAQFMADLGPDDDVSHDVVDPETGELLDWPTAGLNRNEPEDEEDAAYWRKMGGTKRELGKAKYKDQMAHDAEYANDVPVLHLPKGNMFGGANDMAWEFLSELRDSDFYNVVWRNVSGQIDDPEEYAEKDYDVDFEIPVILKRKDGAKLVGADHDNIQEIMKAVKNASTMGNVGLGYAGTSGGGTAARFYPTFH